jgi:hypothetical protein
MGVIMTQTSFHRQIGAHTHFHVYFLRSRLFCTLYVVFDVKCHITKLRSPDGVGPLKNKTPVVSPRPPLYFVLF